MKKVLVLSYYFPPLGLSGVQRITKFVKYLPDNDWQPTVVTARPASYFAFDESLGRDIPSSVAVIRTRSIDPTRWTGKARTVPLPSERKHGALRRLSNRLFEPDNKRFWLPFARQAAVQQLERDEYDLIFSTAPPYSSHLLAVSLGRRFKIPVVLDFRDSWVGNPRRVFVSERQRRRHESYENEVVTLSRRVVVINRYIADDLVSRTGIEPDKVSVIGQGFDPEDLVETSKMNRDTDAVRFVYCGVFYDAQKPDTFLHALARAVDQSDTVRNLARAVFVGLVPDYFSDLISKLDLQDRVSHTGYLDHRKALDVVMACQVAWMTVGRQQNGEQILTGKLAEYVGTRKPILGLVPEGAAHDTLVEYGDAEIVEPDDIRGAAEAIARLVEQISANSRSSRPNENLVESLDRRQLTRDLAAVFTEAVSV